MPEAFDTWLTNKQVAELLHVTRRTLYDWAADPRLSFPQPAFVRNRRYYSKAQIEAWRASRQLGAPAQPMPAAPSLGWPAEQFLKCKIEYRPSERVKSDLYRDMLPLLNSGKVQLLDNRRLINQLHGLERRTARGGRESIDHSTGRHDDAANAAAGAIVLASAYTAPMTWHAPNSRPSPIGARCRLWRGYSQ